MLYDRWRATLDALRRETAVIEAGTGRRWSFADLDEAARHEPDPGPLAFPSGHSVAFILTLLRAWQDHRAVCPLEPGQSPPGLGAPPEGCVHFKLTSASTGAPRAVAFTAEQLLADVENIRKTMGLRPDWPSLGVISFAHSYGFSNLVLPLLIQGIPLVIAASPLPDSLHQAAALVQDLTLPAVPALWRAWHDAHAIPAHTRLALSAGAPLPLTLETAIHTQLGLKVHNFYGATECGGIAYDAADAPRTAPTEVGQPLRGVKVALDASGCLEVHSPAVGATYWPDPSPHLQSQRFLSSDLAAIRGDQIHLLGRASERINVAGRKLNPETVEDPLRRHPAVRDCLVFGAPAPGSERHETIIAVVELSAPSTPEILRAHLLNHLAAWQLPREFRFVPSLAPNNRGKLSRADWRRRCLEAP